MNLAIEPGGKPLVNGEPIRLDEASPSGKYEERPQ
jgi:hypothetical protein